MGKMQGKKYTKDELANELKRFVNEFGHCPKQSEFEHLDGYPSRKTFSNIFGSFKNALEYANIKYEKSKTYNFYSMTIEERKEYIKNSILKLYKDTNKIPLVKEVEKIYEDINKTTIRCVFGTYEKALKYCGFKIEKENNRYSDDFLKSEFERFVKEHGRIPTIREFNNSNYPSFW